MMKKIKYLMLSVLTIAMVSCTDDNLLHPFGNDDGVAPGKVSNVKVRNFSGGATIHYTLPQDVDLSYVCARFKGTNGQAREEKASSYCDSLVLKGFGNTNTYDVELISYDKYENASEPVKVQVKPQTPAIETVFNSLKYKIDFGGFIINFENPTKENIGIYIMRRDSLSKEMEFYDVYFTSKPSGKYAVRGLPNEKNDFAIYIQDYYKNESKQLKFNGTPLPEAELNRKKWQTVSPRQVEGLVEDKDMNMPWNMLWDGQIAYNKGYLTWWPLRFPHRFAMDLGVNVHLSRIKTWQNPIEAGRWQHGSWKLFDVYGCAELPKKSDQKGDPLYGWTLLGEFESIKPSGLPMGQETEEDVELVNAGEEFMIDQEKPVVRYLLFVVKKVHSDMFLSAMSEMRIWGDIQDEEPQN